MATERDEKFCCIRPNASSCAKQVRSCLICTCFSSSCGDDLSSMSQAGNHDIFPAGALQSASSCGSDSAVSFSRRCPAIRPAGCLNQKAVPDVTSPGAEFCADGLRQPLSVKLLRCVLMKHACCKHDLWDAAHILLERYLLPATWKSLRGIYMLRHGRTEEPYLQFVRGATATV